MQVDFSLTTPALLFPTVSLLLLAYTNRFLTIATIIRNLHNQYHKSQDESLLPQIENLRHRVYLIKNMQIFGVLSLLSCVVSMFALFAGWVLTSQWIFAFALILMMISLAISLRELQISSGALDLLLTDLEEHEKTN